MKKHLRLWMIMWKTQLQADLSSRFGAILLIIGKILRFVFFLFFLVILLERTGNIAGYTFWQVILFYATFNLVDTTSQLLLREVYRFRHFILTGDFDFTLTKPMSPLFKSLFGGSDILDVVIFFMSVGLIVFSFTNLTGVTLFGLISYVLLFINAILIALSFHIFVLAIGVLTTEVDNVIWLYRDLTAMGRVPIDVYKEPLRGFITFVVPVGLMITFPVKSAIGILSWWFIPLAFFVSFFFIAMSMLAWKFSLRRYSSASS